MLAQRLRHRIDIQALVVTTDDGDGSQSEDWKSILRGDEAVYMLPAEVKPLQGREFMAAQAVQSLITTSIVIRERMDVAPSMRVVHEGVNYNIRAILPDPSLRRFQTLMCESGVNDG